MSLRLVVVSTPRSGTRYMSKVLTESGLPTGHERVFKYTNYWTDTTYDTSDAGHLVGDSSWIAPYYLSQVPEDTLILYQMREPWRTLNSIRQQNLGREIYFHDGQWVATVLHGLPEKMEPRIEDFWVRWHRMIQGELHRFKHVMKYHVEGIDVGLLEEVHKHLNEPFYDWMANEALSTPKYENNRGLVTEHWRRDNCPPQILDMWEGHC